ncbi:hypothetical protein AVEN_272042-1 [Araneus ventricosus]|uniref:HTH CENPB-type domain-containing protein n=1 Tax=Araneus ventricosus TaxID=182803 RepID=A0A4Y2LMW5_ARAVE|nr:hypothetical protein AVEN_272042-1 [Araneus ventricosus]
MDINETLFKASDGWLKEFKVRHGLSVLKLCGESDAVNKETVDKWKEEKLKNITEKYDSEDIFNADKTGLFFYDETSRIFRFQRRNCKWRETSQTKTNSSPILKYVWYRKTSTLNKWQIEKAEVF